MKKTIRDYDLENKRVIIRCDFNVPLDDGVITNDNRIKGSLETINFALNEGAKVILLSHLGRVKTEEDKKKLTLKPVADRLSKLLNKEVIFPGETRGEALETEIDKLEPGDVLLIENTRFEDLDNNKESKNSPDLGSYWASLGEIYINDAFGTSHRSHASNVGIASILPNGIGFLIEKELKAFGETLTEPKRPFAVILGGSKVEDKIGVIDNLITKADYILIGGGMSFTFLKAMGYEIGKSLLDESKIDYCANLANNYPEKIILPIDSLCGKEIDDSTDVTARGLNEMEKDEMGLDIGLDTFELFKNVLETVKTVVWNGPLGVFEIDAFSGGTKEIASLLAEKDIDVIIGGGDTAAAVSKYGFKESYTHVSTGGGASLELMEGKDLPGIEIINEK